MVLIPTPNRPSDKNSTGFLHASFIKHSPRSYEIKSLLNRSAPYQEATFLCHKPIKQLPIILAFSITLKKQFQRKRIIEVQRRKEKIHSALPRKSRSRKSNDLKSSRKSNDLKSSRLSLDSKKRWHLIRVRKICLANVKHGSQLKSPPSKQYARNIIQRNLKNTLIARVTTAFPRVFASCNPMRGHGSCRVQFIRGQFKATQVLRKQQHLETIVREGRRDTNCQMTTDQCVEEYDWRTPRTPLSSFGAKSTVRRQAPRIPDSSPNGTITPRPRIPIHKWSLLRWTSVLTSS